MGADALVRVPSEARTRVQERKGRKSGEEKSKRTQAGTGTVTGQAHAVANGTQTSWWRGYGSAHGSRHVDINKTFYIIPICRALYPN
jgi:hypothetical protein